MKFGVCGRGSCVVEVRAGVLAFVLDDSGVAGCAPGAGRSGWCGVESGDSDEVVDGGFDLEPGPVSLSADVAKLASSADGFDPPQRFFDPFPYSLRNDVAGMSGGAAIDRGSSVRGVLRDVRVNL